MKTDKDVLRILAEEYLNAGRKKGFTTKQLCMAVSELGSLEKDTNFSNIPKMTEDKYCELFKCVTLLDAKCESYYPKDEHVKKTAIIMYVIHEEQYTDIDEFVKRVSEKLNIDVSNARSGVLGMYPYSGLRYFLKLYLSDFLYDWGKKPLEKRIGVLENIEKKIYKHMLEIESE